MCNVCLCDPCQCEQPCPCGCGCDKEHPANNCVYDTARERSIKNSMNGKPDEQWVIDGLSK